MYERSAKLWGVSEGALLGNDMVPVPRKWGLNPKFRAFPYQLHGASEMFHQERTELNGGVLADGMGTGKTVTAYLTVVLNYHHAMNLDEVATDRAAGNATRHLPEDHQANNAECPSQDKVPLPCSCVNRNATSTMRKQYGASLVIAVPHVITAWRDNYTLLFKDSPLAMQAQAPLRVAMCHSTADVSPGMERPTSDEWLEMGTLGDWTAYDALNAGQTLTDKAKTPCPWFSDSVLPLRKGNPSVSTPAASAVRFVIVTTSKCLKQRVLDNFTITRRVHRFLSSGKREDKGQQSVKTTFLGRVLWDEFHNEKNKETTVNQFLRYYKSTVPKHLRFFVWAMSGTPMENGVVDMCWFIMSGLADPDWATAQGNSILKKCTSVEIEKMAKLWSDFLKQGKSNPKGVLQSTAYKESVQVGGEILVNFEIRRTSNTIGFDGKKLKVVSGELQTRHLNCKYGTEEIELLQGMEGAMASEIEEAFQQKMLEWKEDGSPEGKQPVRMASTSSSTYFACRVAATTPGLLLWKDRCNEDLPDDDKIDVQAKFHAKSIKSPIGSILDENKEEILRGDAKFEALLVICEEVIRSKNVGGYHSKVVIGTDFPTIGAVYMAVSDKTLYLFTS
jgi:hypothetical protein